MNNIALIELEEAVTLSPKVWPACLNRDLSDAKKELISSGWGTANIDGEGLISGISILMTILTNILKLFPGPTGCLKSNWKKWIWKLAGTFIETLPTHTRSRKAISALRIRFLTTTFAQDPAEVS